MTAPVVPSPHSSNLGHLLVQIRDGSTDAFAAFYDRTAPLVYGIGRSVFDDALLAEQVTEEVFLAIWRGAGRYDPHRQDAVQWVLATTSVAVGRQRRMGEPGPRGDQPGP
jgi:RNA polymerase sigma-70 factor (ECF subfamily)